jgi:predicted RNA-binding Zn-ribbon protein involved in translation (DUF1610 family)
MSEITVKEIKWILDFCGSCGTMLEDKAPDGLPRTLFVCPNCTTNTKDRSSRIQGVFTHEEAMRLRKALGHV